MDLKVINFLFSKNEKKYIRKKRDEIDEFFQDIGTYYKLIDEIENLKKRRNSFYKHEMLKAKLEFLCFIKRKIKEDFLEKILKDDVVIKENRGIRKKLEKSDFSVVKKNLNEDKN